MTLGMLLDKAKAVQQGLQSGEYMREALRPREQLIMQHQYQQLFDGKASNGEDIRPYYSEDVQPRGYFRSRESADRYAQWKLTGIPYPWRGNRNPDAPNLYITGKFHEELGVRFLPDMIVVGAKTHYAANIVAKYGLGTFGLTGDIWGVILRENGVYGDVMQSIINEFNG